MPLADDGYSGKLFRSVRLERLFGLRHLVIGLIGDATLLGILNWKEEEHDAKRSSPTQLSRHPLSFDDFISLRFVSSNPVICFVVCRVHSKVTKFSERVLDADESSSENDFSPRGSVCYLSFCKKMFSAVSTSLVLNDFLNL